MAMMSQWPLVPGAAQVPSLDAAVDHIHKFGSGHTESIVTGGAAGGFPGTLAGSAREWVASGRGRRLGLGAGVSG